MDLENQTKKLDFFLFEAPKPLSTETALEREFNFDI